MSIVRTTVSKVPRRPAGLAAVAIASVALMLAAPLSAQAAAGRQGSAVISGDTATAAVYVPGVAGQTVVAEAVYQGSVRQGGTQVELELKRNGVVVASTITAPPYSNSYGMGSHVLQVTAPDTAPGAYWQAVELVWTTQNGWQTYNYGFATTGSPIWG